MERRSKMLNVCGMTLMGRALYCWWPTVILRVVKSYIVTTMEKRMLIPQIIYSNLLDI